MTASVLIVDDHIAMAKLLAQQLADLDCACEVVDHGRAAIETLSAKMPDLIITDLRMAEIDGFDVLAAARAIDPDVPVIIMTAFGAVDSAIEAMRRGAWHYVVKPVRLEELSLHVQRAIEQRAIRRENRHLRSVARERLSALVGRSAAMRRLYDLIERVSPSPAAVLIRGESGTGKELVARAIHDGGPRRDRPFIAINCTALPETLLESELFGHARGAFTGALAARPGLFVEASGGTLFLDEIGDMSTSLQAKLLRVVEQGEIRAVGADASRSVDVRLIAATHQDLEARVADKQFRADLFYRLHVLPVVVPPLRDRLEDVPLLTDHFVGLARSRNPHSPVERMSPDLIAAFANYHWPGNVRELENTIERMVVIGTTAQLSASDLDALAPHIAGDAERFTIAREQLATLRELEEQYIAWVMDRCGGNKTRAAEILGVDPSTLHRRARSGKR